MAFQTKPEDLVIAAVSAKEPTVILNNVIGSAEGVIKRALAKERRLLAFVSGYSISGTKKGLVGLAGDYEVTFSYAEDAPENIGDVVLDNHDFDPESVLGTDEPKKLVIVGSDPNEIHRKLSDRLFYFLARYEGLFGYELNTTQFQGISPDYRIDIGYSYFAPLAQMRTYMSKASFAAKGIWRKLLGRSNPPAFVKAFLAFSYLNQCCGYDDDAFDDAVDNPKAPPSDPVPSLAYGPLVENRGICGGIAWAYKRLMDEAGIPCQCVSGYLTADTRAAHAWNLVRIEGQYYHVDATPGVKNDGVLVEYFMRSDNEFRKHHSWDEALYPRATGMRYQYDFVEDFLADHGGDYLDDGADDAIMFPENIVD